MTRLWPRLRPSLLLGLPFVLLTLAAAFALRAWDLERANMTIAALEAGTETAVTAGAPDRVLAARIGFLAERGRLDEAEPLLAALAPGAELARARYVVANARMRDAFRLLARGELDKAGPLVTLSRQDYAKRWLCRPIRELCGCTHIAAVVINPYVVDGLSRRETRLGRSGP